MQNAWAWMFASSLSMTGFEERNRRRRSYVRIPPYVALIATELTPPSVMLGLDPSIQTAPVSGRGMDPRLKAEDDGMCGDVSAKLAAAMEVPDLLRQFL